MYIYDSVEALFQRQNSKPINVPNKHVFFTTTILYEAFTVDDDILKIPDHVLMWSRVLFVRSFTKKLMRTIFLEISWIQIDFFEYEFPMIQLSFDSREFVSKEEKIYAIIHTVNNTDSFSRILWNNLYYWNIAN